MEEKKTGKVHGLTLKERKYGKLTGVQDIHSFNENECAEKRRTFAEKDVPVR